MKSGLNRFHAVFPWLHGTKGLYSRESFNYSTIGKNIVDTDKKQFPVQSLLQTLYLGLKTCKWLWMAQENEVHVDRNKRHLFCDRQMEEPLLNQITHVFCEWAFHSDSLTPHSSSIVIKPVAPLQSGQQPDATGQTSKQNAEEEARMEHIEMVRCQPVRTAKIEWSLTAWKSTKTFSHACSIDHPSSATIARISRIATCN